jgi:uncharacterized membrane protein
LKWWKEQEVGFTIIGFLAKQLLAILSFQIETKRIFNLVKILIGFGAL